MDDDDVPMNPAGAPHPMLWWPILATLALGSMAALLGGVLDLVDAAGGVSATVMGAGFLLLAASVAMGHGVPRIPFLRGPVKESERRNEIRQWQILKAVSILLNLLAVLSLTVLVFAVMVRLGALQYRATTTLIFHVPTLLAMTLVVVSAGGYLQSLRTPLRRERSSTVAILHGSAVAGLVISTVWGILVAMTVIGGTTGDELAPQDHAMMFLAAGLFLALDLFVDRPLPTVYVLLSEERDVYSGHSHFKRSKSVLAPTLGAFSLLFLVFLVFVAFSGGISGLWDRVTSDASFVIVLALIVVALLASGVGAFVIARSPDEVKVYRKKVDAADALARSILIGSLVAAAGFAILATAVSRSTGILGIPTGRWTDLLALAALVAVGPYGFYAAHRARRIRRLEERFPDFLRDLASSHRGGLTLPAAVTIAARGDYGPLTEEVGRMADQMSWNVSFREALQRFSERVKTPLVERAVNLILEADRSGGSTSDVLLAAARDARQIKTLENERGLSMTLYTIVIYITFGVFLLVAAVLYGQFIPEIVNASESFGGGAPGGAAPTSGQQIQTATLPEYRAFYHIAALSQALGSGIVAGMMGSGKAVLGLRHSFIMLAMAATVFGLFLL